MFLFCNYLVAMLLIVLIAQRLSELDERVSQSERLHWHKREWLCLHSDQLMIVADLVVAAEHREGRLSDAHLAQWNEIKAKSEAMRQDIVR